MSYGFKEFSIEVLSKVNKPLGKMDIWNEGVKLGLDKNIKLHYINDFLISMRYGGASNNGLKGYLYNFKESYRILKDNHVKCPFLITCWRSFKTVLQILFGKFEKNK